VATRPAWTHRSAIASIDDFRAVQAGRGKRRVFTLTDGFTGT
jgi:hypothetical protein